MRVEFINPFIQAAKEVFASEIGGDIERGSLSLQRSAYTTRDVTTLIAITGAIAGVVLYAMDNQTACSIVSRMLGQEVAELDDVGQSGIAELGNVISGRATTLLADAGYPGNIAPPVVIVGNGTMISTLDIQRLIVPLTTACGLVEVQVALREVPGGRA